MTREKFSLVIITYNNADTLERCLAAADFADEVVVLDYGRKIGDGPPQEVRANPEVIKAYLGSSH